jgi:hypothetical protein
MKNKMKTQTKISNLKKLGLTVVAAVALSGSIFASGSESVNGASVSLNILTKNLEQSILYKAPAAAEEEDAVIALESLEAFSKESEASIMYKAPENAEDEVYNALEELESFTSSEMASIRYEAPSVDQDVEVATELESLQMFADKLSINLKYQAPESDSVLPDSVENADNMMAETK